MKISALKWPEYAYAGVVCAGIALAVCLWMIGEREFARLTFYAACILSIVGVCIARYMLRRLRQRLIGTAGLLCPRCRYSLWGLASPGECPECGRSFTFRSVQEYWAESMRMPELLIETEDPE